MNKVIAERVEKIDIDAKFTKDFQERICRKILPEEKDRFCCNFNKSLKSVQRMYVDFLEHKDQEKVLKGIEGICRKIIEKRNKRHTEILVHKKHPKLKKGGEKYEIFRKSSEFIGLQREVFERGEYKDIERQLAEFLSEDIEYLINKLEMVPNKLLNYLKMLCPDFGDNEKLRNPCLQEHSVHLVCGTCVASGVSKKGRNRTGVKISKVTVKKRYNVMNQAKGIGRSSRDTALFYLCAYLALDYHNCTGNMPYRMTKDWKKSDDNVFVDLVKQALLILNLDHVNADNLVKAYISKMKYKLFIVDEYDQMTTHYNGKYFLMRNAVVLVGKKDKTAYFIDHGKLVKDKDVNLAIKIPNRFKTDSLKSHATLMQYLLGAAKLPKYYSSKLPIRLE